MLHVSHIQIEMGKKTLVLKILGIKTATMN